MPDPKITDNQIRNCINVVIGENENGASWEKLSKNLRFDGLIPQIKRVLEELERSKRVYLKGKRYQLTKKGFEIYDILIKRK